MADIFGRKQDSGTWQTWARNLGLPPQKTVTDAQQKSGAKDVLAALDTSNRASAIGIIALNDIVPTNGVAPKVRPLAFRAKGQDFAYYPSSTSTASDMINVRDGHYAVWANLHFFARKTNGQYTPKRRDGPQSAREQGSGLRRREDARRSDLRDAGPAHQRRW